MTIKDREAAEFRALWDEFEASETPEAKYALSLDRLQAVMLNLATDGGSWKEHRLAEDVRDVYAVACG